MTDAILGNNTEILYQELSLESLPNRRMLRRLCPDWFLYDGNIGH